MEFATNDRSLFSVPLSLKTYSPSIGAKLTSFNNGIQNNGKAEQHISPDPISDVSVWDALLEGEVSSESGVPSLRLEESWPARSESSGCVREKEGCGLHRAAVGVACGETSQCGVGEELNEKRKLKREGSTLARYVQRFRSAPPTSRDSREMLNQEFWWSQASQPTETATRRLILPPELSTSALTTSHDKSQFFTDAIPRVSSEDSQAQELLGQSSEVLSRLVGSPPALKFLNSAVQPSAQAPQGGGRREPGNVSPSGDILTRWRLRRRLEQARKESSLWTRYESCLCHNVHDLTDPQYPLRPTCSAERHGLVCSSCGRAAGGNRSSSADGGEVKPGKDTCLRCTGLERTRGLEAAVSELNSPSCRGHSCRRKLDQVDVGKQQDGHFPPSLPERKCTWELKLVGGGSQSVACASEAGRLPCSGGSQRMACVDRAASVERAEGNLAHAQVLESSAEHAQTLCDLHEGSCDVHTDGSCDHRTERSCDHRTERSCDHCIYDCIMHGSQTCTVDQLPALLLQPPRPATPHALGQLRPAVEEEESKTTVNQHETTNDAPVERMRPYPCHGGLALRDLTPSEEEDDQFTLTFSEDISLLASPLKSHPTHALPDSSTPVLQGRSDPNCSSGCLSPTSGTCKIPVQPLQKEITRTSLATTSVWCCEDDELLELLMTKAKFFEAQIRDINCFLMVLQQEETLTEHSDHVTLPK